MGSRGSGERAGARDDEGGVFARHVDLPRGPEREIVRERKRSYELNGREGDALATINLPAAVPVGFSFYVAYVTLDMAAPSGIRRISNPLNLTIQ